MYMSLLIILQAYGNVTMDCTIVAFYAQAKTQLQMIRFDLEHFNEFDRDTTRNIRELTAYRCNIYRDLDQRYNDVLKRRLERCVKQYEQIVWYVTILLYWYPW